MCARRILLLSSSGVYGYGYLEYPKHRLINFYKNNNIEKITFIAHALESGLHDRYTRRVEDIHKKWGFRVNGMHEFLDPIEAIQSAQCLYAAGGNAFILLKTLYSLGLVDIIRDHVLNKGLPFIGSSAGSVVATRSIHTANNMAIVQPSSFTALGLLPFNINPHFKIPRKDDRYQGVKRDEDLKAFVKENKVPVLALPDTLSILVHGDKAKLIGPDPAILFNVNNERREIEPNSDISFLLALNK